MHSRTPTAAKVIVVILLAAIVPMALEVSSWMHSANPASASTAATALTKKISKHSEATRSTAASRLVSVASKPAASLLLETVAQTLNNCGPSSVSAVLAHWHVYRSEAQVQAVLRADNSYWGMSPVDLPAYARSLGMRALVGYGGTEKLVKLLLANGFPVIASQYVSSSDPVRHYRPIEAYNDRTQTFISADPYLGAGHTISYGAFKAIWAESDFRFQVIYPPSLQAKLNAVLAAAHWNKTRTFERAIVWEEQQMQSADFQVAGSWISYNGYIDVAFDRAQLGQYRKAQAELTLARRQGANNVAIGWVEQNIQLRQQGKV